MNGSHIDYDNNGCANSHDGMIVRNGVFCNQSNNSNDVTNSTGGDVSDNVSSNDAVRGVDFNDCIGKILNRSNDTSTARRLDQNGHPPLTPNELAELSYLCTATSFYDQQAQQRPQQYATEELPSSPSPKKKRSRTQSKSAHGNKFNLQKTFQLNVEIDTITSLVDLLSKHVQAALGVHLMESAIQMLKGSASLSGGSHDFDKWLNPGGIGNQKLLLVRMGLEAASIITFFACCNAFSSNNSTCVDEDAMESCIALFRLHLAKHLIPALNQTGHLVQSATQSKPLNKATAAARGKLNKRRRSSDEPDEDPETDGLDSLPESPLNDEASPDKTTSKPHPALLRDLKKLYRLLHDGTMKSMLLLFERLHMLVQRIPLDDQQVLLLANGAFSALEIDCFTAASNFSGTGNVSAQQLMSSSNSVTASSSTVSFPQQVQISSIGLITSIFQKYASHRDVILEDVFPMMLKLPSYKRSLRSFPVRYSSSQAPTLLQALNSQLSEQSPPHSIQMMTALILSLVHCCVIRPTYGYSKRKQATDRDDGDSTNGEADVKARQLQLQLQLQTGLLSCWAVIDSVVSQLLQRCSVGKGDTASEFRPFLLHFVEDLLLVMIVPEYPAAEHVLLSIQRRLNAEIMQATPAFASNRQNNKLMSPAPETTYINLAFDVLAKINVVQARLFSIQRKKPLKVISAKCKRSTDSIALSDYCESKQTTNVFMISCDSCQLFFHGSTVGIRNADCVPDEWYCDSCRLGQIAIREQRKYGGTIVDDKYVIHHAYMTCLTHGLGAVDIEDAIRFHFARWIDDIGKLKNLELLKKKIVDSILGYWDAARPGGPAGELLTDEGSTRTILAQLTQSSPLLKAFRAQISFLVKIMTDEHGAAAYGTNSIRKLSLKTIEKVVAGDPELMLSSIITKAVSSRLTDESISVREAAVSLVGAYVVYLPAVANAFHASLLACLNDVGVSVRKRCVRIFQSILTSSNNYEGRSVVCDTMLKLASNPKEEDGVRDLIHELFFNLWLSNGNEVVNGSVSSAAITPSPVLAERDGDDDSSLPLPQLQQRGNDGFVSPGSIAITPSDEGNNGSSITSSINRVKLQHRRRRRADIAAEQMMEVVRTSGTGDHLHALLIDLLVGEDPPVVDVNIESPVCSSRGRRKSSSAATVIASKKRAKMRIIGIEQQQKCVQLLVDSLFELLVAIEERRTTGSVSIDGKDIAATLQTLDVMAKVAPLSIMRHIDTLLPYLKADNGVSMDDESLIVGATCDVLFRLSSAASYMSNSNDIVVDRLGQNSSVANDLVQITYKFGASTLNSAVRALSVLTNFQHHQHIAEGANVFVKTLVSLSRTFYSFLYKRVSISDFAKTDFQMQSSTHRALTVLGLLCQYHEDSLSTESWEAEVDIETSSLLPPKSVDWSNLSVASYRLFSCYLQKNDTSTKCKAMEAFGGLFLAQPRLVLQLEKIGLITDVMSEKAVLPLQLEALDCWKKILVSEEQRIDGGEADAKMDSDGNITVSKKVSGDQDGDATLFGGVLTNHSKRLFDMTHSKHPQLRFSALELLGLLLRQGLVNPNEAVPYLFALQGDIENVAIRSLALRLLMSEGEKRPDILRQRICAGVKQAYRLQRSIYSDKMEVSAVVTVKRAGRSNHEVDCIFSSVFRECIMTNRKQRQGLYRNLLGLFEVLDSSSDETTTVVGRRMPEVKKTAYQQPKDIALLSFVAQVLAHLPYNTANDPLFIVHHIGSIITLQGPQCLDKFASFLRPYGLSGEDDLDENNLEEDALERAAVAKFPSRTHQAKPMSSKEFDLMGFINLIRDGASLCFLLRLKSFLCSSYNLSLTRCMEYDPNAKERLCDKGMPRVSMPNPFNSSFPAVLGLASPSKVLPGVASAVVDKDSLIRQYGEFRRLMREEHTCDPDDGNSCQSSDSDSHGNQDEQGDDVEVPRRQ